MYDPTKHLIRVQGNREYLPVAQRLVWFREAHPDWGIETAVEHLDLETGVAVFRATVKSEKGQIMAQATKVETARGFPSFVEKAESGAIGRALALCGFGTQFAPDLEEVQRPAGTQGGARGRDAPAPDAQGVPKCRDCGGPVTRGQLDYSERVYGEALCPGCQKKRPAPSLLLPA